MRAPRNGLQLRVTRYLRAPWGGEREEGVQGSALGSRDPVAATGPHERGLEELQLSRSVPRCGCPSLPSSLLGLGLGLLGLGLLFLLFLKKGLCLPRTTGNKNVPVGRHLNVPASSARALERTPPTCKLAEEPPTLQGSPEAPCFQNEVHVSASGTGERHSSALLTVLFMSYPPDTC